MTHDLSRRKFIASSSAAAIAAGAIGTAGQAAAAPAGAGYRHITFHNFIDGYTLEALERYVAGLTKVAADPLVVGLVLSRNLQPRSATAPYEWMMSLDNRSLEERLKFYGNPVLSDFVRNVWQGMYSKRVIIDVCQPMSRAITDSKGVGFRRTLAFSYKDATAQADRDDLRKHIEALLHKPAVRNSVSGPSYKPKSADMPYEWLVMLDFADQATGESFFGSRDYTAFQSKLDNVTDSQVNFDAKDIRPVSTLTTL